MVCAGVRQPHRAAQEPILSRPCEVGELPAWRYAPVDDGASLSAVLAVLFEREARSALSRTHRGYRTEDQSLPVVRGRLRLVDQALRRFGAVVPIEVTVDEWTVDTDDNRRIRAAAQWLLTLADVPTPTRGGLRRVHRLLHLADLVLAGASVEHRAGDVVAYGFTLNLAWVFERLLERLLVEECSPGPGGCGRRTGTCSTRAGC